MDPALQLEVAALSRQRAMNDVIGLGDSEIQRFYNNSVIFITGGSGFIGKQLVEKLLRSCNISKVFMLLRSKKGRDGQERLDAILNDPVFDAVRKHKPDFAQKINIVGGDVSEIRLGLKHEDWETLTTEVDVIFHVAATTKFDETLRVATLINVRGTREILDLGKACKKLKTFVHVSTAYTHATTKLIGLEVEEEFYKACVPPEALISMVEAMNEERLINVTPELIKDWPNTYTFTKSIAEELVRTTSAGLPICILRPGIVQCSYTEPSPGWIDLSCIYGASGFLFGLALGIVHTIHVKLDVVLGLVPCDYVNNAIIAAGRETATLQAKGGNDTKIYTVTSTRRNPVKWGDAKEILENECVKIPTPAAIAYNFAHDTKYKLIHMILSLLLHLIPAYIADFVCLLMGKERRLLKRAKMLYNISGVLSFFMRNEWTFLDDNLSKLYSNLSNRDKIIFNFDLTDIIWKDYVIIWCIGIRKYIIKDGLKDTLYAIKKQKILRIITYIFMTLYVYTLWKLVYYAFYIGSSFIWSCYNTVYLS